jgi:formylglycine-generating enzyme required for sulfatase activity
MQRVLTDEPLAPRSLNASLPRDLETIALKCLHKEPARRYASAADLAEDLRRWHAGEPIAARPAGPVERTVKWVRRRPTAAAVLAGSALAGVLLLALSLFAVAKWRAANQALAGLEQEKRERALEQVDALLEASPAAVPAILARLEQSRDVVLPRLRQWYKQDEYPPHRLRLALALLPTDTDDVIDGLAEWMLTTEDPAEVLLVRGELRPYSERLTAWLWSQAEDQSDHAAQLRALAALADYDPESPHWQEHGVTAADQLLAVNPLHLGAWVSAFEPVRDALLPRLSAAFTSDVPERRQTAAAVLATFVKDRPDALADLLLEADARQLEPLRPLIEVNRDKLLPRLRLELTASPPRWNDEPPESWKEPDAATKGEIARAGGLIADRFALCQSLPSDRLADLCERLRGCGYRPISARPWAEGVAVVWSRDGGDWRLAWGVTIDELKRRDEQERGAGFLPADVAAYETKEGLRYVALWRRGQKGEKAELYAGLTNKQTPAEHERLGKAGLSPGRIHALLCADGVLRYASVWVSAPVRSTEGQAYQDTQPAFAARVRDRERLLLDLQLTPATAPIDPHVRPLADLEQANKEMPDAKAKSYLPLYQKGAALFKLGRDKEAFEALDEFIAKGKPIDAYRYRAVLHARAGRAEQARRDLAEFEKLNTVVSRLTWASGLVDVYLGDVERGLKTADDAALKGGVFAYEAACVYSRAARHLRLRRAAWAAAFVGAPSAWGVFADPGDRADECADRALALLRRAIDSGYGNWSNLQADSDLEEVRGRPGYRRWLADAGVRRLYTAAWSGEADREAEALVGLEPQLHLRRCREMIERGYRPVSLSLTTLPEEDRAAAASVWHRPALTPEQQGHAARRRASAAALLLVLGEPERAWPLFAHQPDPTVRSYLVGRAGDFRAHPRLLIEQLEKEKTVSARRALILVLGEFSDKQVPRSDRAPLVKTLLGWYRDDPDPGIHAAIDWLLRHDHEGPTPRKLAWNKAAELDRIDLGRVGRPLAGWYVTGQGQTMVCVRGPVVFPMGSPHHEADRMRNEIPHPQRVGRSFAIASKPVTFEQWARYRNDNPKAFGSLEEMPPGQNLPMTFISWMMAAQYCNWLSEKEGIPKDQWCYPEKIESGMKLPLDYLSRTGYRLPTAAEWEYACRAGSTTAHSFGSTPELLPRYAIYRGNSNGRVWPVGQKRPNDLGLFDLPGNVAHWCQERGSTYGRSQAGESVEDVEDPLPVTGQVNRRVRTGSYDSLPRLLRAATLHVGAPEARAATYGFRVARTLP